MTEQPEQSRFDFTRQHPFSNGTEFMFWEEENCNQCEHYVHWENADGTRVPDDELCPIEKAIGEAAGGVIIPKGIARIAGFTEKYGRPRQCACFKKEGLR